MKKYIIFILMVMSLFSRETLKIGVYEMTRDIPEMVEFRAALTQSLKNLGYDVDYIYLPSLRSIEDTDKGILDGDMPRVKEVIKSYKNIFQIDIEIDRTKLYAYNLNGEKILNFKDFENKKIGIILGTPIFDSILMKNVKKYSVEKLKDVDALGNMLKAERVDLLFLPESVGDQLLNKYPKANIRKNEKPISEVIYYLDLNKKYLKLKEPLELEMKKQLKKQN